MTEALWSRLWFRPGTARNLGITRAVVCAGLLAIYATGKFAAYGSVATVFHDPRWLPVAPEPLLRAAHVLWLATLALGALGLFTRPALTLSFLLGGYLLALDASFGRIHHNDLAPVIALGVLALSRAGDAFSLDALRRHLPEPPPDAEYSWPLRAIQLTLTLAFLAAGISKLRHAGLDWVTADTLRLRLVQNDRTLVPSRTLPIHLARYPLACNVLAAGTVGIELLYPLALVSRTGRALLVPASLLMLLGFAALFGPRFTTFGVLSAAWVPWGRVLRRLTRRGAAPGPGP
jgi:hypothetical protein